MPTNIERNVMRRVRTLRRLRLFFNELTASCFLLLLTLYGLGREVWVARVFQNMPSSGDVFAMVQFYLSAFLRTELVVQVLSLIIFASLLYLVREIARRISFVLERSTYAAN